MAINIKSIDLNKIVLTNLSNLKEREKEILILRFGLDNESPKTLQSIGKKYHITRERVRQIINYTFKKLKKNSKKPLLELSKTMEKIISEKGGLLPEEHLASSILAQDKLAFSSGAVEIICRINQNLKKIKKSPKTQSFWTIDHKINLAQILNINKEIVEILNVKKKIKLASELANDFKQKYKKSISDDLILSISIGSNNLIIMDLGKIGLSNWPEINPKNTRDKIYYVLNLAKKPLHFHEITEKIHEKKFVTKNPTQATVHNELISDKRFVLIGRGIYALTKWGYEPGTVCDLLKNILKDKNMTQEQICQKLLQKRIISKNTILMNLNSNPGFAKNKNNFWYIKK